MTEQSNRHRTTLLLIALTSLGVLLRLWFAWRTNQQLPDAPVRLSSGEAGYDGLAVALLEGYFFRWPGRMPIYPLFLSGIYAMFGHSIATAIYIQALVSVTAVPLTFFLTRRFISGKPALIAAALIAVHPTLVLQTTRLYSEVLYTPLLLLALMTLLWAMDRLRPTRFLFAGLMLGLAVLTWPTAVLLILLLPFCLTRAQNWRQRFSLAGVYLFALALLLAPWAYHNYRTHDKFLPLSVSAALLWRGSPEYYHLLNQGYGLGEIWGEVLNPEENGGHDPYTIHGDRYFNRRALASIQAEPGVYARYTLQKAAYFWLGNPRVDWYGEEMPWMMRFGVYATRLLPLLTLTGLVALRQRLRPFLPLLLVMGLFTLFHALTFAQVRYSEPLHPLMVTTVTAAGVIVVEQVLGLQPHRRRQTAVATMISQTST